MKKIKYLLILLLFLLLPITKVKAFDINYQAHVQKYGWMNYVDSGNMTGTTGQSLRMEALRINVKNNEYSGGIAYRVHVQRYGWMTTVGGGSVAGTTGQSLRMEAIKIELTGEVSQYYDVYYRVHVQNIGWMEWVKNGQMAGTTGKSLRMESLEIKLVEKETKKISLTYQSHNSDGWLEEVKNNEVSGITDNTKSIDLFKINLDNKSNINGDIVYQVYNSSTGWTKETNSNNEVGIENSNFETIKIRLTDNLAQKYNIFYRVYSNNIGWLDWTSNGMMAGTTGFNSNIGAIQIKLQSKEYSDVKVSSKAYIEDSSSVTYSSHVQSIGWQGYVKEGEPSGSLGNNLRLESIKIKLNSKLEGNITYKTFIARRGWSKESTSDIESGTTGLSRNLEAISINLTGSISNYYDVYYRTYIVNIGWLDWARNGETAGALNSNAKLEAVQIKLVRKGETFVGKTTRKSITGTWKNNNTNYYDCFNNKVTGFRLIDGIKYFFDEDGKLMIKNAKKVIDVSSWQGDIDWDTIKKQEDVDAAIIRVGWGTSYNDACGVDSKFDRNIKAVQRLGIPYAIYIYAYAETESAATKEAEFIISKMNQYNIPKSTFVWYDAELSSIPKTTYIKVIPHFVNVMKSKGYNNVGVYSGVRQLDTLYGNLYSSSIRVYPIWVAQYYRNLQYTGYYKGWQFQSDGQITGINGNVDVSAFY